MRETHKHCTGAENLLRLFLHTKLLSNDFVDKYVFLVIAGKSPSTFARGAERADANVESAKTWVSRRVRRKVNVGVEGGEKTRMVCKHRGRELQVF